MRKEIMKDGNSHKIRLNAEDMKNYSLSTFDMVDIPQLIKNVEASEENKIKKAVTNPSKKGARREVKS